MKKSLLRRSVISSLAALMLTSAVPVIPSAIFNTAYAASAGQTLSVGNGRNQHKEDNVDGYSYEIWLDNTGGSGSMTLGSCGAFNTEWSAQVSQGNFLARRGRNYDASKKATQYGPIVMNYAAEYSASSQGNSRLCVYGWFKDPLVEYYIIEDWVNWRPSAQGGAQTITVDNAEYEIFQLDHTGPTILGDTRTFKQYFSVRKQKRTSGTITVSDHFAAWEKAGWNIGNLTEVALNVEGWESSGKANVSKLTIGTEGGGQQDTTPVTTQPVQQGNTDNGQGWTMPGNGDNGQGWQMPGNGDNGQGFDWSNFDWSSFQMPGNGDNGQGWQNPGNGDNGQGWTMPGNGDNGQGWTMPGNGDNGQGWQTPGNNNQQTPDTNNNTPTTPNVSQNSDVIRIMPAGDSITFGMGDTGGYRKYLDYFLKEKGYNNIDFVGPEGQNSANFSYNGKSVSYDDNHAGYSGYTIKKQQGGYGGGLYDVLKEKNAIKQAQPDIILLIIGTNDMNGNRSTSDCEKELHDLLDYMLADMPSDGMIFLSTIPELTSMFGGGDKTAQIAAYNDTVKKVADEYHSSGKNVTFADIHGCLNGTADLGDGIHPNAAGYEKMGKYWAGLVDEYLKSSKPAETTTTSTTTTTTTTKTTTTTTKATTAPPTTTKEITTTTTQVKATLVGDANINGGINISDAVLIMQALANPSLYGISGSDENHITSQGWANADCCSVGDGVTANDALSIQKYTLKLIDKLPE